MLRKNLLASALVLTLSLVALGDRFTPIFDSIEITIQGLQEGLPDPLDKSQKKAAKIYKSTLKKLSKDTDSLKKEIKLGKSIAGKLAKLDDGQVEGDLLNAADALQGEVLMALDAVQQRLPGLPSKITEAKVQKQIDAGYEAMERATTQEKLSKRFAFFGKAEARARKAAKLADKLLGGGGECTGTDIAVTDTVIVTRNLSEYGIDKYATRTGTDQLGPFTQVTLTDCDGRSLLDIRFPDPLTVGQYSGGSLDPATKLSFFVGPTGAGNGVSNFGGSAEVTNVDGRLQLTFMWDTGDVGSAYDGTYEGTLDLPAVN